MAPKVEAGEHDDPLLLFEIEQAEWESTQNGSAYFVADKLIEARTQAIALFFVGSRNVADFAAAAWRSERTSVGVSTERR